MKNSAIIFALFFLAIAFVACDKQESLNAVSQLETDKFALKKQEPAEFTFKTDAPAEQIKWSVSPNQHVQITPNGNTAKIHFGEAGRYLVTATDQHITSRTTVTVDTTTYVPGDTTIVTPPTDPGVDTPVPPVEPPIVEEDTVGTHPIIIPLTGDEFTVTPYLSTSDTIPIILKFDLVSTKSYQCLNSYINHTTFYPVPEGKTTSMQLQSVTQPGAKKCIAGEKPLSVKSVGYFNKEGVTKFEIIFEDVAYRGSVTKVGSTFTIDWPYTSGIKFSKLVLTE